MCTHACVYAHVAQSIRCQEAGTRVSLARPHWQQPDVLTPTARAPHLLRHPSFWLCPHLSAPVPRSISVTRDPPWEKAEQSREGSSAGQVPRSRFTTPVALSGPPSVWWAGCQEEEARQVRESTRHSAGGLGLCVPSSAGTG